MKLNSSPRVLDEMNDLPIKVVNGATVYLKDVAQVRDGYCGADAAWSARTAHAARCSR